MADRSAPSPRAQARLETIEQIKQIGREHLAADGPNLSLRAVARDLGVVSSAIYRYFASRDELLTALIIDAYNAVGQVAEDADASVDRGDFLARWLAVTHGVRDWAIAVPHEYMLIYGSPVPGYKAPMDTVPAALRGTAVLGAVLSEAVMAGVLHDTGEELAPALKEDLTGIRIEPFIHLPETVLV